MQDITIRNANEADAPAILACLAAAFAPYRNSYTPAGFTDTVPTLETIQQRLTSMCVLVALNEAREIVGTIACSVIGQSEGHLRGMAVLPAWQGRGIAEQLLRTAENELLSRKCLLITLDTTEPLQRAMRFYERQGYRRSGKVTDFFGMPLHEYVKDFAG